MLTNSNHSSHEERLRRIQKCCKPWLKKGLTSYTIWLKLGGSNEIDQENEIHQANYSADHFAYSANHFNNFYK